jgi:hypothetical protein
VTVARDVLVELDVHQAILAKRMHTARFSFTRLEKRSGSGIGT